MTLHKFKNLFCFGCYSLNAHTIFSFLFVSLNSAIIFHMNIIEYHQNFENKKYMHWLTTLYISPIPFLSIMFCSISLRFASSHRYCQSNSGVGELKWSVHASMLVLELRNLVRIFVLQKLKSLAYILLNICTALIFTYRISTWNQLISESGKHS